MRGSHSSAKAGDAGLRVRRDRRGVERIEQADQDRAALELRQLVGGRSAHLEHDVGAERLGGAADARAGGLKVGVGNARRDAGAGLDDDLVLAARRELLDGFGRGGDARLARAGFAWNADDHGDRPLAAVLVLGWLSCHSAAGFSEGRNSCHEIASAIALPRSAVVALPPRSGVRGAGRRASPRSRARSPPRPRGGRGARASAPPTRSGRSDWRCPCPRCPAPSRAPARTVDGNSRSGLMLADGAMPIVPHTAGPRSDRMSPNRLEPTTTSNQSGCSTKCAVRMSMWYWSVRIVRILRRHRAEALVPVRHGDRDAVRLGRRGHVLCRARARQLERETSGCGRRPCA